MLELESPAFEHVTREFQFYDLKCFPIKYKKSAANIILSSFPQNVRKLSHLADTTNLETAKNTLRTKNFANRKFCDEKNSRKFWL